MITYQKGDIFTSNTQAIVNPVNTVGVMGKGLALAFKNKYPYNYEIYRKACLDKELSIGDLLIVNDSDEFGERLIINFPTKQHWRNPSEYSFIEAGLKQLVNVIQENNIKSIAIPALGCGLGGLDFETIKNMIEDILKDVECHIFIFQPN